MIKFIQDAYRWILEAIFPDRCVVCRREGPLLCQRHKKLQPAPKNEAIFSHLDDIHAAVRYYHETAQKLIEFFKFRGFKHIADLMADEMIKSTPKEFFQGTVLVPIPLHWTRRFWRGFNQAELLAISLNKKTSIPIQTHLKRNKRTKQQARLNKAEREQNITNAFIWDHETIPQRIILVDDVVASGSTLDSAAQVLKEAGAKYVSAFTFARGGTNIES